MPHHENLEKKEKEGCECPFCDEPTCPVPEEIDSLCRVVLVTCPSCNQKLMGAAAVCPHCGKTLSAKK